ERTVPRRSKDEARVLGVRGLETPRHDGNRALPAKLAQLVGRSLGHQRYARRSLEQQPHLLRGRLATADDQHICVVEVGEEGEVSHKHLTAVSSVLRSRSAKLKPVETCPRWPGATSVAVTPGCSPSLRCGSLAQDRWCKIDARHPVRFTEATQLR